LADLISHHIPVAIAGGVAKELTRRYGRLDVDEMALFDMLDQLAEGGSIYKVWIEEDDLVPAMNPELEIDDRRHLLANMKSRRLLEEGAGKWRAVW
jgi:hypothetical protein